LYFNTHFINIKINGQEGAGKDYKAKFNVRGYPTVLFFQSNGLEIDRICGYNGDKSLFYQTVLDYVDGKNTLGSMLAQVNQSPDDVAANFFLARKYIGRWESAEAQPYLEKVLELDPRDAYGHNEECRGYIAVYILRTTGDDQPLIHLLDHSSDQAHLEEGFNALIRYYQQKEMQAKLFRAYEQAIQKLPENTDFMNGYAWYIYEQKAKDRYEQGIGITRRALQIKPEAANIWDTLAWLEFDNGQIDLAIEHMKKAVELAPQKSGYLENLKKMEQAQKL